MKYQTFSINKPVMTISANLNYFNSKNLNKIAKFYYFIQFLTNRKPFLKKACFKNLKKKILKSFMFNINLRGRPFLNFFNYLKFYYFYFYSDYFTNPFSYANNTKSVVYSISNPYLFFKNYKLNYKFCLKFLTKISTNKTLLLEC